jgi:hypothetical protein
MARSAIRSTIVRATPAAYAASAVPVAGSKKCSSEAAGRDGRTRELTTTFPPLELPDAEGETHESHDPRVERV